MSSVEGRYRSEQDGSFHELDIEGDRFRFEHSLAGEWGSNRTTYRGTVRIEGDAVFLAAERVESYSYTAVDDEPTEDSEPSSEVFELGIVPTGLVYQSVHLRRSE